MKLHEIDLLSIKINWIQSRICEQGIDWRLIHNTTAQHSVHPTGGSLRVCRHFAWLEVGSVKIALPRPAHQRVTQTVSQTKKINVHHLMTTTLSKPQNSYYLIPRWRILLLICGFFGILTSLLLIFGGRNSLHTLNDWLNFSLIFLLFFLLGVDLIYQGLRSRLVTTAEGIIYYQPHFKLIARWEEIDTIVEQAGRVILVLQKSSYEGNPVLRWFITRLGAWDRLIPLDPYIGKNRWRVSEFGNELKQYAPYLIKPKGIR